MKPTSTFCLLFFLVVSCGSSPMSTTPMKILSSEEQKIQSVLTQVLTILSGEKNKQRDWDQFLSHFTPDATIGYSYTAKTGLKEYRSLPVKEFAESNNKFYSDNRFYEQSTQTEIFEWNGIASAHQAYTVHLNTSTLSPESATVKGINYYRLVKVGNDWKIVSLIYAQEDKNNKIPVLNNYN